MYMYIYVYICIYIGGRQFCCVSEDSLAGQGFASCPPFYSLRAPAPASAAVPSICFIFQGRELVFLPRQAQARTPGPPCWPVCLSLNTNVTDYQ